MTADLSAARARVKNAVTYDTGTSTWTIGASPTGYQSLLDVDYGYRALCWVVSDDGTCWVNGVFDVSGTDLTLLTPIEESTETWSDGETGTLTIGPPVVTNPYMGFIGYASDSVPSGSPLLLVNWSRGHDPLNAMSTGVFSLPAWAVAVQASVKLTFDSPGDATYFAAQIDWYDGTVGEITDYLAADVADAEVLYLVTPVRFVIGFMNSFAVRVTHDATTARAVTYDVSLELFA